jgi:hypothetical protein
MHLTSTTPSTAAIYPITMAHTNIQSGQEVRLFNLTNVVSFRLLTGNTRQNRASFVKPGRSVLLRSDGYFWYVIEGGFEPFTTVPSITFGVGGAAIPAGATSDEVAVAMTGVILGDEVRIGTPYGSLPAKVTLQSRVAAGNIYVWARNEGASAWTAPALNVGCTLSATY